MAEALNDIETSQSDPARIYVSSNAYFCVTNSCVTVLDTLADADKTEVNNEMLVLSETITSSNATNVSERVVIVSSDSALDMDVYIKNRATELTGVIRDVAIVSNKTVTDDTGSHGICWAAAAASIINYYLNGCATSDAEDTKEFILQYRLDEYGSYVGYVSTIKSYIQMFSGATIKTTGSMLSWSQVTTAIYTNNAPCCTIRSKTSGETGLHAMVLCGYYYATSDPSDSSHYWLRIMDPNLKYTVLIPYSASFVYSYVDGTTTYNWTNSIIKS